MKCPYCGGEKTHNVTFVDVMLSLPCAYCAAGVGEDCVKRGGERAPYHSRRFYAAKQKIVREGITLND